ncbi:unnamed protein product, partial [Adineta steineri]
MLGLFSERDVVVVSLLLVFSYALSNYKSIQLVFHPDRYHGNQVSNGIFFEGWYYKLVLNEYENTIIAIPGVSMNDDKRFSFIMIAYNNNSHYFRFPYEAFSSTEEQFLATVDNEKNIFSYEKLIVNLQPNDEDDASESFQMNLTLSSHLSIPDLSVIAPATMGPFTWIPTMQCYHHVL